MSAPDADDETLVNELTDDPATDAGEPLDRDPDWLDWLMDGGQP